MSWATEALAALRKIITLEEKVGTLTNDLQDMVRIIRELDQRLVKLEPKIEIYERMSEKGRRRHLPSSEYPRDSTPASTTGVAKRDRESFLLVPLLCKEG